MERIFKRFTKLNHRMPNSKGFGLGLSIAMELADLNFGSMSVESELGRGSTFSFTLPMAIPQLIVSEISAEVAASAEWGAAICVPFADQPGWRSGLGIGC